MPTARSNQKGGAPERGTQPPEKPMFFEDLEVSIELAAQWATNINSRTPAVVVVDERFVYILDPKAFNTLIAITAYVFRCPTMSTRFNEKSLSTADGDLIARTMQLLLTLRSNFLPEPTIDMEMEDVYREQALREEDDFEGGAI